MNYTSDLVSKVGITDNKTVDTPLEMIIKMHDTDGVLLDDEALYQQLVKSLISLTIKRPDISHGVHIVRQFITAPRTVHFGVVFRILRYLLGIFYNGLLFSSCSKLELPAFSDSDWAGDINDRHSMTSYCIFLCDSLVS